MAFVLAHLTMVFGLRSLFDTFISLVIGILAGLAAYYTWRQRPEIWLKPLMVPLFVGITIAQLLYYNEALKPPPEPPPLAVTRGADGKYTINRGGRQTMGRPYAAIPDPTESATSPRVLGVGVAGPPATDTQAGFEWVVLRHKYRDRARYSVRPLYGNERVPGPADYVSLIEQVAPGRVRIDAGKNQGVRVGDAYALFVGGFTGTGGYVVIEGLEHDTAIGYLVGANPKLPYDADRLGPVSHLISLALSKGELALVGGRIDDARAAFQQALDLSGGKNDRARERLAKLPPPATEAPSPAPASSPAP